MNITINNIFKNAIITGLSLVVFIPTYVANSLFFPFISGKAFAFRIIVEIVFALWLILILREKGTSHVNTSSSVVPRINTMTVSVTLFTVIILIADLCGLNPLRSIWSNFERMEGWMTIVHLWAYFIVLSSVLNTKENWHKFFNVVLLSGFITAIYGLFQFFGWAQTHQGATRVDASLGNSAYMAVYMLMNAFIAAYMAIVFFVKKNLFWIYAILALFFSAILFQTSTRGTIIAWFAAIIISAGIYAIFGKKSHGQTDLSRIVAGSMIGAVIILGVLFYHYRTATWIQKNAVLGRLATISLSDTKTQARGFIWPMAIKGTFDSTKTSIIGRGQENFNYIFNSRYDPKMWMHEQWFDRAHSVFLDWLVAGGVLGLLSYLVLYIISLFYIWKSTLTMGQKSILVGLLAGYSIHNVFVFDNQTSYIMFFIFLAFVHVLKTTSIASFFKNHHVRPSEDYITVRDYILVPLIVIAVGATLYFVNVRPIQANTRLIAGLQGCSNSQTISVQAFKDALAFDQTVANQEIREQLYSCATNVLSNPQADQKTKSEIYDLVKVETEKQIQTTPNDVRIYMIAGSFYDSIREFENASPLLEKAILLSPDKQSIMYELATNYFGLKKVKEGVAIMEKAYLLAPESPNSSLGYVVALISSGDEAKARKIFSDQPELFSDQRVLNAYIFSKQYTKAIELYKDLIKKTPDNPELYSGIVNVYLLNKQDSLAIQTLKDAIKQIPLLKSQIEAAIKDIQAGKFSNYR